MTSCDETTDAEIGADVVDLIDGAETRNRPGKPNASVIDTQRLADAHSPGAPVTIAD